MIKPLFALLVCMSIMSHSPVHADYAAGCEDPEYHRYINARFTQLENRNRRLFEQTLQDYQRSAATSQNPYQVIGDLTRHIKYSAQFDPIEMVTAKIDRIFEHADALSTKQKIAGDVFDRFSSETHAVGIARAWIAYRQGNHDAAFDALLTSIDVSDSAVLRSFGPDFNLVRRIYHDGHRAPVLAYINKTEAFWTGKRPDSLRYVWREMIKAGCKIQFDSVDAIKAQELGLGIIDINKDYGLSR